MKLRYEEIKKRNIAITYNYNDEIKREVLEIEGTQQDCIIKAVNTIYELHAGNEVYVIKANEILEERESDPLIDNFNFSVRIYNVLKRNGVDYKSDLDNLTAEQVRNFKNMKASDKEMLIERFNMK